MNLHKAIRFLMHFSFLLLLSTFLILTVKEKYESGNLEMTLPILLILGAIWMVYRYLDVHHDEHLYEDVQIILWVPIGAVACYLLNISTDVGGVLAAGVTGTLASYIPSINKKSNYLEQIPPAIYCGSFIGMSSVEIAPSLGFVVAAGALSGAFLFLSKSLFLGIGGKLGTIAFAGVAVVSLLLWLFQ